jgi:hypothetical protein
MGPVNFSNTARNEMTHDDHTNRGQACVDDLLAKEGDHCKAVLVVMVWDDGHTTCSAGIPHRYGHLAGIFLQKLVEEVPKVINAWGAAVMGRLMEVAQQQAKKEKIQ